MCKLPTEMCIGWKFCSYWFLALIKYRKIGRKRGEKQFPDCDRQLYKGITHHSGLLYETQRDDVFTRAADTKVTVKY